MKALPSVCAHGMLACQCAQTFGNLDGMRKKAGRPDSECPSGDCESAEGA